MNESISASDLISVPTMKELKLIDRSTKLFGKLIQIHSYHGENREERLDAWFRHEDSLPDDYGLGDQEAVSQFRHSERENGEKVFGPWAQVFNLSNPYLSVTIVHELAHLVDRYHLRPRDAWTSSAPQLNAVFEAYSLTRSCWIAYNARGGRFVKAVGPDGQTISMLNDATARKRASDRAARMLLRHEVFARCLTAFIFYESSNFCKGKDEQICDQFFERMASERNQISGYDLSEEDYAIIRQPLLEALTSLGWTK